jgi:N-acylglucosamine-6-phosphate 2-epimerase
VKDRSVLAKIKGGLIVSCQARRGQPFDSPSLLVRMALAAAQGGAVGIRADTPPNIRAIQRAVPLPIIGVNKKRRPDRKVFITPTYRDAAAVARTGAQIIGLECTFRDDRREVLPGIVARLNRDFPSLLMAEVSSFEEAVFAEEIGCDLVATTLVGYTEHTARTQGFDYDLLDRLVAALKVPIIAEGHLRTPAEAAEALRHGAFAIVAGKAITMPSEATRWFVEALQGGR